MSSATFKFALPEDLDSDQLLIYDGDTRDGTFTLLSTIAWDYGTETYELDTLDETKYYKIQFNNSVDGEAGPMSEAVFGGDFENAAPFLAISTTFDGAQYATVQDCYDYATLTPLDVSASLVSKALRRARALVDLRTTALNLDRFSVVHKTDIARKKHNSALRILKEAEINIALGNLYRALSDDLVLANLRKQKAGTDENLNSITLGSTSLATGGDQNRIQAMGEIDALGVRYLRTGMALLASLQPTSITLKWIDEDNPWPTIVSPLTWRY